MAHELVAGTLTCYARLPIIGIDGGQHKRCPGGANARSRAVESKSRALIIAGRASSSARDVTGGNATEL